MPRKLKFMFPCAICFNVASTHLGRSGTILFAHVLDKNFLNFATLFMNSGQLSAGGI